MTVLHAPTEKGAGRPLPFRGTCPECLTAFRTATPHKLFCCNAHRDAWNNRATVRGRVLTPLAIVARVTRNGTRGARSVGREASSHAATLIQRYVEEDRAAGRMPWPEYLALRYRAGFDPL